MATSDLTYSSPESSSDNESELDDNRDQSDEGLDLKLSSDQSQLWHGEVRSQ